MGENKQSVGELMLGFFRYYTETFPWSTDVVTIRRPERLSKRSKEWDSKPMAVEGAFGREFPTLALIISPV